jgi:hypothetical protein
LNRFLQSYSQWLEEELHLSENVYKRFAATQSQEVSMPELGLVCPVKCFVMCSRKVRREKTEVVGM